MAKRRPSFVVEAVTLLSSDTTEHRVHLGALGNCLQRVDPAFSPQRFGHSGLLEMVKTYDRPSVEQEPGGHRAVSPSPDAAPESRH